jgi:hypothetical protein
MLTIDQGKTEGGEQADLEIPVHPKLREIIDATPMVGVKPLPPKGSSGMALRSAAIRRWMIGNQARGDKATGRAARPIQLSRTHMLNDPPNTLLYFAHEGC